MRVAQKNKSTQKTRRAANFAANSTPQQPVRRGYPAIVAEKMRQKPYR